MAWKLNAAIFCLLIIGLSPLGQGAALRGEGIPKPPNLLNGNGQGRLLFGQNEPKSEVRPGKLIIGLNSSTPEDYSNIPESLKSGSEPLPEDHYQADQAVTGLRELQQLQGSVYSLGVSNSPAVHQLLGMRPKVDCDDNAMMLRIHGGIGSFLYGFLIDRGNVPPLPLSRVPSGCGLHVQKTRWGLVFVIPYNGCYVAQEVDTYIFPLRLWGLPAKMSCPMSNLAPSPPSVSCYPNWLTVKVQVHTPVEDLWVKVGNEWKTLLKASSECGYSVVSHSEKVEISAPYKPCMEAKDGMYSFHMAAKNEFKAFCPSLVPSLPPDMSSPVSSDQTDINTVAPIGQMPPDTSSIPVQRPTVWPSFGRPYQSPTLKLPPLPYKPTWTGQRSVANLNTQVPTPTTSSAKSHQVGQISSLQFPITQDFFKPQRTPPITKVPDSAAPPKKPNPAPVDSTSTSRTKFQSQFSVLDQSSELFESSSNVPEKPILLAPESVPSAAKNPSSFLGEKSFYPVVHQMRPVTPERRFPFSSPALQKPAALPTAAPSKSLEASNDLEVTGVRYQTGSEKLSGSAFFQELHSPQYPKRPATFPAPAPSTSVEASYDLGVTDVRYQEGSEKQSGSVFDEGLHPPQYPKRPATFPTPAPSTSVEASYDLGVTDVRYQAGSEKLSGSAFVQELHPPQYPKRPATFPIAAPSISVEAFGGLREADSSFLAVPLLSKPFGYSECCPSTALYSSCCPSQASYHQHTHHHFGFPHPVFNPGAAAGSARSATSSSTGENDVFATQSVAVQTVDYESRSGALPQHEEIQQGASRSLTSSYSPYRDVPMKPSGQNFIPQSKRLWAAGVPQLLGPPYKSTTATSLSQDYKPVSGFPPNRSQSSFVYGKLAQRNQNVGPAFEENHHPSLPTSSQTNPEPLIFLPHEKTSRLNYGHPAYPDSTHFDDESLTYSEAKVPPAVDEPYPFPSKSELPEQDTKLLQPSPGLIKHVFGSEPQVHLKAKSHEQVHGTHGSSPYSSSDSVTRFQALSEPFNKHWVPVVHPKQGEEVKSFAHHT